MKKILFAIVMAASMMLAFTSCKDVKPEFKFQLALVGDVADSATCIAGDFDINVCNNADVFATINDTDEIVSIIAPEGAEANRWLENYIEENVINEFYSTTEYSVSVKGFVHEVNTGMTFSVDKTFTNHQN